MDPWENRAACRGRQQEMALTRGGIYAARVAAAKAICAGCPVLDNCRAAALTPLELDDGRNERGYIGDRYEGFVAGGLTPDERKPILAATNRARYDRPLDTDPRFMPAETWLDVGVVELTIYELDGPTDAELAALETEAA